MTRRSISIEPREIRRRFVISQSLDCDMGSLNRRGWEKAPTDKETKEFLEKFLETVPELFCFEALGPREFLGTLIAGRRWYDDEIKVVEALANEAKWESGSFTVDPIPLQGYAQIRIR